MENFKLTNQQKELVEKLGVLHERSGFSPASARIVALLLVADKNELTFDEIREALQLSKSATSNALNLLLASTKIEYVTRPGDRKRYFRSRLTEWQDGLNRMSAGMEEHRTVLQAILHQRPAETKAFNEKLHELIGFLGFVQTKLPEIFKQWEAQKK